MLALPPKRARARVMRLLTRAYAGDWRAFNRAIKLLLEAFDGEFSPWVITVSKHTMGRSAWGRTFGLVGGGALIMLLEPAEYKSAELFGRVVVHEMAHACAISHDERLAQRVERQFVAGLSRRSRRGIGRGKRARQQPRRRSS